MKPMPHSGWTLFWMSLAAFCSPASGVEPRTVGSPAVRPLQQVEADWLRQEQVRAQGNATGKVTPEEDAVGGCDGVKDGKNVGYYGFHTDRQDKPWWQVDLGAGLKLDRTVIYNGSTPEDAKRALGLCVLVSKDAQQWTEVYRHDRSMFCGPQQPLTVPLRGVEARYVRVQLPYVEYLHLDEIEVYAVGADRNVALHRPATQSSVCQWSRREITPASEDAAQYPAATVLQRGRKLAEALQRQSGIGFQPVVSAQEINKFSEEIDRLEACPAESAASEPVTSKPAASSGAWLCPTRCSTSAISSSSSGTRTCCCAIATSICRGGRGRAANCACWKTSPGRNRGCAV